MTFDKTNEIGARIRIDQVGDIWRVLHREPGRIAMQAYWFDSEDDARRWASEREPSLFRWDAGYLIDLTAALWRSTGRDA